MAIGNGELEFCPTADSVQVIDGIGTVQTGTAFRTQQDDIRQPPKNPIAIGTDDRSVLHEFRIFLNNDIPPFVDMGKSGRNVTAIGFLYCRVPN